MAVAAGKDWSGMLRSDGAAVVSLRRGAVVLPAPSRDMAYAQISIGLFHIALLTGDGAVEIYITNPNTPRCDFQKRAEARRFSVTQTAAEGGDNPIVKKSPTPGEAEEEEEGKRNEQRRTRGDHIVPL